MKITANNTKLKSWLKVDKDTDFPIQNIPFGVFLTKNDIITVGTRIGDYAIDLAALHQLGYFKGIPLTEDIFMQNTLNDFISDGQNTWRLVRNRISEVFDADNNKLRDTKKHRNKVIFQINDIEMQLPIDVCDYTDFFSSKEHAMNVGKMYGKKKNLLRPNWLHMPLAYHGRSSSVVVSGTKIRRPHGQTLTQEANPVFGPSKFVDFEIEMGFITTDANKLGKNIPIEETEENIFGMVLLNDWSSRDIQDWESVPLGPFLAKNFATTISPWIITMDALQPFRVESPEQDPKPMEYLQKEGLNSYDIHLQASIKPKKEEETIVCNTNFKYMYWTIFQQLAHHTINGCNVRSGDLFGSGTVSGSTEKSFGSMLELAWKGTKPIALKDGSKRTFLNDNDAVILRAYCQNEKIKIGFGECKGRLKKAKL